MASFGISKLPRSLFCSIKQWSFEYEHSKTVKATLNTKIATK